MISTIAFDYDGVLHKSQKNLIAEITGYLGIDLDTWHKVYFSLNHISNVENKPWEDVMAATAQKLGASDEQIKHLRVLYKTIKVNKVLNTELVEFICELKKTYRIALISNYPSELRDKLINQNILSLFEEVILSGEVGYQKPQPEIFKVLCSKMNIPMNELIFIDDTQRSLEGAELIGYKPILYKDNESYKLELLKILNQSN